MTFRKITIESISEILGTDFRGENVEINALNLANRELKGNNLTYVGHESYLRYLDQKEIVCALVTEEHFNLLEPKLRDKVTFFLVDNPEKEFYKLHHYLYERTDFYFPNLDANSCIGENVTIHPTAVIDDGVIIKNNVQIGPNAVIHAGSVIGNNVVINAGVIIGEEGFQVLYNDEAPYLVKHVGGVLIHDNVSIGANTCIAKSLFDGYTEIGSSTKIDNLVSIAHNCKVGENCVLTSGVIMTGSSMLDDGVWLAPNAVVLNKIKVGKESLIGALALVTKNVEKYTKAFGLPAIKKGKITTKLVKKNNKL
ncbi:UDP-3-O-(3-hydroxymyristoyl)glucosamine N-acyltransferase [Vibrio sp. PNB23_22_7]